MKKTEYRGRDDLIKRQDVIRVLCAMMEKQKESGELLLEAAMREIWEMPVLIESNNIMTLWIMNLLGREGKATKKEANYIKRWTEEMGFSLQMIEIACERTVMATDKYRFEYVDSILTKWEQEHIRTIDELHKADAEHQRKRQAAKDRMNVANNQFNQFPQRNYDFDVLEKALVNN